jgi:uncharacterized protein (TIGR00299 family) protein
MLLGAVVDAGAPLDVVQLAVDAVVPGAVRLRTEDVRRGGFVAIRCLVEPIRQDSGPRTWADVKVLLAEAPLAAPVREAASRVFSRLAQAEARVHGRDEHSVHFHEVGALDSIADVVGTSAGLHHLGVNSWVSSPVGVGAGTVRGAHGVLPVPVPAVVELLREAPTSGGPGPGELCTPTGAALVATFATSYGGQPAMTVRSVGIGAGARDPRGHANVTRLLVGESAIAGESETREQWVLEANVDDLDPRIWPHVLTLLMRVGAADAWLTPILMKKGRPGHTLHVLADRDIRDAVRTIVVAETTTLGFREHPVHKHALERTISAITVEGHEIDVKVARYRGRVVTAQPEHDHAQLVAARSGRPLREVLDEARWRALHPSPES